MTSNTRSETWRVTVSRYRYLRNPMYVGVGMVIAGLFALAVTVLAVGYEQPTLRARYGASYEAYCRSVPAVVPRLRRRQVSR
jgi:protein-S-isoprenylcysteine O-methyltransferase Ste14